MTKSKLNYDLEIAPDYRVAVWCQLKLDPNRPTSRDWITAINILKNRIQGRFLDPVDVLICYEKLLARKRFGFAILAIDFLVIETLQGFKNGIKNHNGKSKCLITEFLKNWGAFADSLQDCQGSSVPDVSYQIYRDYRCALHHSGATEGALRVGVSGPMIQYISQKEIKINRTKFHTELKKAFENYLKDLRQPENNKLRENFLRKMNYITGF